MANLMKTMLKGLNFTLVALLIIGCAQQNSEPKVKKVDVGPEVTEAVATIQSAEGEDVSGTVKFTQTSNGVEVVANLQNLSQGKHGFHIHEKGDCSNREDFSSAGGHYNPTDTTHGSPTADARHVGDMGNVPAGPEGMVDLTYTDNIIQLNGKYSVVGRAVIIHQGEDDLESQPSGDAGSRIGCGVIGIVQAE